MEVVGTKPIIYGQTERNKWDGNHPTQRFKNYLHNQYITLITVAHQNIYGKATELVILQNKDGLDFVYHQRQQEIRVVYLNNPRITQSLILELIILIQLH